jgi:hypothetical protein
MPAMSRLSVALIVIAALVTAMIVVYQHHQGSLIEYNAKRAAEEMRRGHR